MTLDTVLDAEPMLTREGARKLTDEIKANLERDWQLIIRAYTERAWEALGHTSWDGYCVAEFGAVKLRLPREDQHAVIKSLREAGLSTRAIASATGASQSTVSRDLRPESDDSGDELAPVIGLDGKRYRQPTTDEPEPEPEPDDPNLGALEDFAVYAEFAAEDLTEAVRDLNRAMEYARGISHLRGLDADSAVYYVDRFRECSEKLDAYVETFKEKFNAFLLVYNDVRQKVELRRNTGNPE